MTGAVQIYQPGGGGGSRSATITVAANNSSATAKAQSDYVCSAANPEIEAQAAIEALAAYSYPEGGGKVVFHAGKYSFTTKLIFYSQTVLQGMGRGTHFEFSNTSGWALESDDPTSSRNSFCMEGFSIKMSGSGFTGIINLTKVGSHRLKNISMNGNSEGIGILYDTCLYGSTKDVLAHYCATGFKFQSAANHNSFFNCNTSNCTLGVDISDTGTRAVSFYHHCFESNTTGLDIQGYGCRFDDAYFEANTTDIVFGGTTYDNIILNPYFQAAAVITDDGKNNVISGSNDPAAISANPYCSLPLLLNDPARMFPELIGAFYVHPVLPNEAASNIYARDVSGRNSPLKYYNAPTRGTVGQLGKVTFVPGSSQYGKAGENIGLDGTNTIILGLIPTAAYTDDNDIYFWFHYKGASDQQYFRKRDNAGGNVLNFGRYTSEGGGADGVCEYLLPYGAGEAIVVVLVNLATEIKMYINGVLRATADTLDVYTSDTIDSQVARGSGAAYAATGMFFHAITKRELDPIEISRISQRLLNLAATYAPMEFTVDAFQYPAPGTDWTPQLEGAHLAASLGAKKVWLPLNFLKQGDKIISYKLVGDIVEANTVTLDCKLVSVNLADPLTTTDVAGGGMTQLDADGDFDSEVTLTAPELVVTDKQYVLEILGTTNASDAITVIGVEVKVQRME